MKVLIVGGGGREHAIATSIAKSSKVDKIYCAPGNAGIGLIAECVPIGAMEFDKIVAFAKEKEIDLTIVGMDDPLVGGLVDRLEDAGLKAFGPRKNAAILEGSKAFSKDLMKKYESKNRGIRIIELDKSYQMCTKKEMYDYLIRVAKQPKKYTLTDVLLETMSIIAYKQPITKIEVEKIRGVKSDHAVNKLVEYGLVEEVGRLDAPGRPILFGTTEEFLRRFSVPSIDDLPSLNPEQLEHFKEEAEDEAKIRMDI
jgi:segregation and condensation protein B